MKRVVLSTTTAGLSLAGVDRRPVLSSILHSEAKASETKRSSFLAL